MQTAKQRIIEIVRKLPNDCTFEEAKYQIYVAERIQKGIDDDAAGRSISHEQVKRAIKRWRSKK